MNYQIIADEQKFREFIDWLPELKENEQYYVTLFARKKYLQALKSDKSQLKRFTSKKEYLFDKVRQLECAIGSYTQDGISIPQEALALYITINPRDLTKAGLNLMVKIAQLTRDAQTYYNPHQEALSQIQTSCTRKIYYDLDIDENDESKLDEILSNIKTNINEDCLKIIRTRGGVHCLVELQKIDGKFKSSWYKNIAKFGDVCGDNLIPVPGTFQGGFIPKLIKK